MKITDIYKKKKTVFSCEVFPPKPEHSLEKIYNTISELTDLNPDFISVTYGAAGGTKDRTVEISSEIKNRYNLESLMHLTCINSTKSQISRIIAEVKEKGIENILALRGDIPEGSDKSGVIHEFQYALDLVDFIKHSDGFSIGVAGYPERHPESKDSADDIKFLKKKVDSGADFIISQLFFNNDYFYRFIDGIRDAGVDIPVSAGIMPVFRAGLVEKMVTLCGATIPSELRTLIERYGDKPSDMEKAGIEYASEQVCDLIRNGAEGIHIYMMNRPGLAGQISRCTGLR